jgi:hypothetical protein
VREAVYELLERCDDQPIIVATQRFGNTASASSVAKGAA